MIATEAVNTVPTTTGKIRFVCQFCGRMTGPRASGRFSDLPNGWACAPYPAHTQHPDGSTGTVYRCPPCTARRDFPITPREYLRA